MYKGPMVEGPALASLAAPAVAAAPEAVPLPAALAAAGASGAASALSVYVDDTPKARNEAWARLHGDPMLMVRSGTHGRTPVPHAHSVACVVCADARADAPRLRVRRSSSRSRRR
jgi:hypothetical protein